MRIAHGHALALVALVALAGCKKDADEARKLLVADGLANIVLTKTGSGTFDFAGDSLDGEHCTGNIGVGGGAGGSTTTSFTNKTCDPGDNTKPDYEPRQKKACDAGSIRACGRLGAFLTNTPAREAEARVVLERACGGGEAAACGNLGVLTLKGRGGSIDASRARSLFDRACDGGAGDRCSAVGVMYMMGEGGSVDGPRGLAAFRKGCEADSIEACLNYGRALVMGDGGPKDIEGAKGAFEKGCRLGSDKACQAVKNLGSDGGAGAGG